MQSFMFTNVGPNLRQITSWHVFLFSLPAIPDWCITKPGLTPCAVLPLHTMANTSVEVRVVNTSRHPLPEYATALSAGMDLRAHLNHPITLNPLQRVLVPTGLFIELPQGTEAQIRPRSGLAFKHGVTVLNSPGTIDADYRGEVKVLLVNISDTPFVINDGERIAQMVVAQHATVSWQPATELNDTQRGAGGFGHTGTK